MAELSKTRRTGIPPDQNGVYSLLLDGLRMLASDYNSLRRELPDFVYIPDEVSISFSDAVLTYGPQLVENSVITERQYSQLLEIELRLSSLNPELDSDWSIEAFSTHATWQYCREEAYRFLLEAGEDTPTKC